ncbi:MAG: hypothetical protein EOP04_27385 [Proteobacteria bacterium]|nr:MAG: hypothetical protein EOP04_27385 [Pseudomonadota bacterium]
MNHKMWRIHLLSVLFLTLKVKADPTQLKRVPATITIYVPVRNIRLERRQVQGQLYNFMPTANSTYASVVAQNALPLLFRNARRSFPKGMKLMKFPETKWNGKGEVMYVSLSKQFVQPSFWKGERQTSLRFMPS